MWQFHHFPLCLPLELHSMWPEYYIGTCPRAVEKSQQSLLWDTHGNSQVKLIFFELSGFSFPVILIFADQFSCHWNWHRTKEFFSLAVVSWTARFKTPMGVGLDTVDNFCHIGIFQFTSSLDGLKIDRQKAMPSHAWSYLWWSAQCLPLCCAYKVYSVHFTPSQENSKSWTFLPCPQKYAGFHSPNYNIGSALSKKKGPLIIV